MIEYKGYIGRVEFDDEQELFHGEVLNTRDVITFQGTSVSELRTAFRESIDDYLAFCQARGEQPDKPHSGQFMLRVDPELHRRLSQAAAKARQSLNAWITSQLQNAVSTVTDAKSPDGARPRRRPPRKRAKPAAQSGSRRR